MTSRIEAAASAAPTRDVAEEGAAAERAPGSEFGIEEGPAPAAGPGPPPAARRDRSLPLRVLSAVLFLPLLVLLARAGGLWYLFFTLTAVALMLGEFYRMMLAKGLSPHRKSGFLASLLLPVGLYLRLRGARIEEWHVAGMLTFLLFAILLAELRRGTGRQAAVNTGATLLGVFYIGWLGSHLVGLRELPPVLGRPYAWGMSYALLPFFLAWTCDTAAYGFGRALGRTRLAPAVSPRKSVEGAVGGFLAAVAAALVARSWFAPYLTWIDALVLGILVGFFAQVGDLVESLLKRDAETKDSSALIPGHGGVLDRFDSLLFAAPVVYYYLVFRAGVR